MGPKTNCALMKLKLKLFVATVISLVPTSTLRAFLYRTIFKYTIKNSQIGFLCVIAAKQVNLDGAHISKCNLFWGNFTLSLNPGSKVGPLNLFLCPQWTNERDPNRYLRSITLEAESMITSQHYFDICSEIRLGKRSWIAGTGSQFWTHGQGVGSISIGADCYIGSACRFAPGVSITDGCTVGIGSILKGIYSSPNATIFSPKAINQDDN